MSASEIGSGSMLCPGPFVMVPARLAGPLATILGRELTQARREGRSGLEEFEQLARDLMAASLMSGRPPAPTSDVGNFVTPSVSGGEMTVVEASHALGLSVRRTRQLLSSGELTGRRAGGVWLLDVESVQARTKRSEAF